MSYIAQNNRNQTTVSINNEQEAIEYADRQFKDDAEAKQEFLNDYKGGTSAYYNPNNNTNVLFKENAINIIKQGGIEAEIASVSPLHEIGHQQVIEAGIIKNDKLVTDSANDLVQSIIQDVQTRFEQGKMSQAAFDNFNQRIDLYRNKRYTETEGVDADELIQIVGDFTALGILPKSSFPSLFGAKTFINGLLKKFNSQHAFLFQINKPSDIYSFITSYQSKAAEFKLGKAKQTEGERKKSVSQKGLDETKQKLNALKDGDKTVDLRTKMEVFEALPTMIDVQVKNLAARFDEPTREELISDIQERMLRINKQGKSPDLTFNGTGQVYGFLNGRIRNRLLDALKADRKRVDPLYVNRIDADALTILEKQFEPDVDTKVKSKPEAKKYKNLVQSEVLPAEAANSVMQKVVSTTRVLKSRIDAAVSLNRTITPLIAEIKKEIGKQSDIEFKKMLGAKRGGELRENLLNLKRPILENMTTTFLMQAMPFAVQKQVDGKFTSDWQGQKIDRETVDTDDAGRTSGAEIVRRVPNPATNVSGPYSPRTGAVTRSQTFYPGPTSFICFAMIFLGFYCLHMLQQLIFIYICKLIFKFYYRLTTTLYG